MIEKEFYRFLQTINTDDTSDNVKKIANLVLLNIDTLISLSTSHGKRIKKIVEISKKNWKSISSEIYIKRDYKTEQTNNLVSLKRLSVGPFRGFTTQEDFDLSSKLVLVYGPNGTGKSSFCEALEYSLIGYVAEAESKRFRNQNEYLKNAYKNSFTEPTLIGVDNDGNEISISSNESIYRFCFVEKNRIDNFSRIAAQTPSIQTELIASLFGLDNFFDFVNNFTESMEKYIDLQSNKSKELDEKRNEIKILKKQLEKEFPEEQQKLEEEKKKLAREYKAGYNFKRMVNELNGDEEKKGLIDNLEEELQKPIPEKSEQTFNELKSLQKSINSDILDLTKKNKSLIEFSQQVSFKQLYECVIQVQKISPEKCPACQTPLSQAKVNPFEYATGELENLKYLSKLQESIKSVKENINYSLTKLSKILYICCKKFPENNPLKSFLDSVNGKISIDWWDSLHMETEEGVIPWNQIELQVQKLEKIDKEINKSEKNRDKIKIKLKRLRDIKNKIINLQAKEESLVNYIEKAKKAINEFETENKQLIKDVEAEKDIILQNCLISEAYSSFVERLKDYTRELPAKLIGNLGELIVTLYNSFNQNDRDFEKLAEVRLPLEQKQRIEISFVNEPDNFFDALHILSEGHIRCIGLAILTAKNIKENCPYIIFDDPVNAIDNDHREAIRRTLFEDSYFENKQIILTCHGEEFLKDIQNLLSVDKVKDSKTISFLPKLNKFQICIDRNCSPRNYIIAARTHYNKNEIRDALDKSRKALESLTKDKIWKYVSNYGDSNLSIKLRYAKAPIELRNLTEQLRKKIAKSDFTDQNKDSVLLPIESLLGINGQSREWRYLNKGTHEESNRAEFDRQTVDEIISKLEQLDSALG